ncbi:hypothetical protein PM082_007576 [Marasmius tenuissimus]|nr:hypothetical protein PM082_007576 [Marasmius tenuissimus]
MGGNRWSLVGTESSFPAAVDDTTIRNVMSKRTRQICAAIAAFRGSVDARDGGGDDSACSTQRVVPDGAIDTQQHEYGKQDGHS